MEKMNYYNEDELNKSYRNQYRSYDFITEKFVSKFFDEENDNLTCKVKGYCINSFTPYCRVCRNWDKNHESPFKRVFEDCYYLRNDNKEIAYKHAFNKVAWGACAFFFYVKYFDDDLGVYRYEWSSNIRGVEKCRQHYFDTCYNIYKAQNKNRYKYYEENNNIDEFNTEFAKHHIESERKLIERTVNTKDIFEEYDKALGIRQEAEEYLEWVRSTYLPSKSKATEDIKRNDDLLKLFDGNPKIYDFFVEQCNGQKGASVAKQLSGAIKAICDNTIDYYLQKKCMKYTEIHIACQTLGLIIVSYDSFKDALKRADNGKNKMSKEIEKIKQEYKKLM